MNNKKNKKKGTPINKKERMMNLTCSACGNKFRQKPQSFLGVTLKGPCPKCKSPRVHITKIRQGLDEDGRYWD